MRPLRGLLDRLRGLGLRVLRSLRSTEAWREIDDELRFHLEMSTERWLAEGLSPAEARRRAHLEFGGVDRFRERTAEARGTTTLEETMKDIRYAVRTIQSDPVFSAVAILTLALGIGGNTALYSVVRAVILEPLPYESPEGLVRLHTANPEQDAEGYFVSPREFDDWRNRSQAMERLAAFWPTGLTLTGGDGAPERIAAVYVTPDFFELLGVAPLLGRTWRPDEGPGSTQVAILREAFWERRFGRDPGVIGRVLTLDGQPVEVVGVVSDRQAYPEVSELWINMNWSMQIQPRQARWMSVLGRVREGGSVETVREEAAAMARELEAEFPDANRGWTIRVEPLVDEVVGETRTALWILLGATGLILLIACANVASLLLSRSEARSREIAIRAALGAGKARLARQLLTESVVLALLGAVAGLGLGWAALRGLLALAPSTIPRLEGVALDGEVLALTVGVSVVTGLLFGMAPVARLLRGGPFDAVLAGARGQGRRRQTALQKGFVVGQVALATMLVVAAGLLVRSFEELREADLGFQPGSVVTFELDVPPSRFAEWTDVVEIYRRYAQNLEAVPGVRRVGLSSSLPLVEDYDYNQPIGVEGVVDRDDSDAPRAFLRQISPDLPDVLGIPVVSGRGFEDSDDWEGAGVALVNESFVRRYFPEGDAVGRRLSGTRYQMGPLGLISKEETEVIGVLRDLRYAGLRAEPQPAVYFNFLQAPFRRMSVVLAIDGDATPVVAAARAELAELVPDMALSKVQTMTSVVERARARDRFSTALLGALGLVALSLAGVGVYGLLAYTVEQRVPELGIRMALGADSAGVRRLVLREGLGLAAAGLALGLVGALASGGVMSSQLYGISPRDPAVLLAVVAVLAFASLLATWLPAHRATRVDPASAMRAD